LFAPARTGKGEKCGGGDQLVKKKATGTKFAGQIGGGREKKTDPQRGERVKENNLLQRDLTPGSPDGFKGKKNRPKGKLCRKKSHQQIRWAELTPVEDSQRLRQEKPSVKEKKNQAGGM